MPTTIDDSLTRSARTENAKAWIRPPIVTILSMFLMWYVGLTEGLIWLALMLGLEAWEARRRHRTIQGLGGRGLAPYLGTAAISVLWVAHALILWRIGEDLPRIIALMDLFTVSIYAAIGAHRDLKLMLCLLVAPLTAMAGILTSFAWAVGSPLIATLATIATLGTCATILGNGLSMHRSERDLARANQTLALMADAAQAANAAKSHFLTDMSHEIRTPLNGVVGVAAALAQTRLDDRQREMVDLIHASGEVLEELLSDLLDLSKIEAGKLTLKVDQMDLQRTIETAAHLFRARANEKGLGFSILYGDAARGLFEGDATRLRQIVSNLVSNAVKFTTEGDVGITVDVTEGENEQTPCSLQIDVRDDGVGFDEEVANRLFQRFEQVDESIAPRFGGTGLGLSISKGLVTLMGGAISARSSPGEGSAFTVALALRRCLPLAEFDARQLATDTPLPAPEAEAEPAVRVLVAEDNEVNRRVAFLLLEQMGVSSVIVENGQESVAAFRLDQFDLVLMDMQMPVMDGLDAARAIRRLEQAEGRPRTPIAMVSANAMADHIDQAIAAGCDLHFAKPITPVTLASALSQAKALRLRRSDPPLHAPNAAE